MKNKNKKNQLPAAENTAEVVTENQVPNEQPTAEVEITLIPETSTTGTVMLGRPKDPNSKRQQELAAREAKRANGELKKGRPIVGTSKRQQVLAIRAAKQAAGVELKKGRPIVADSKRQLELAEKAKRKAAREAAAAAMVVPVVPEGTES